MYKLRNYVSKKILLMIYYSLIYPFLIYAVPVWGTANKVHLKKIHILQKKVVRLIQFEDGYPRQGGPLTHSVGSPI